MPILLLTIFLFSNCGTAAPFGNRFCKRHLPSIETLPHLEKGTVRLISGGKKDGVRTPEMERGISGGVYYAVIDCAEGEKRAIEKIVPFGPLNRERLARQFTELAGKKGLGPKYFGFFDAKNSAGKAERFLYTEEVGGDAIETYKGQKVTGPITLFRERLKNRFLNLTPTQENALFSEINKRMEWIRSYHPDGAVLDNFVLALTKDREGKYVVVVQGVDWDYPMENLLDQIKHTPPFFDSPTQHPLYRNLVDKLGKLSALTDQSTPPIYLTGKP